MAQMEKAAVRVVSWLETLLAPLWNLKFDMGRRITLRPEETKSSAPVALLEMANYALGDQIRILIPYADFYLDCTMAFCWLDPTIEPELAWMLRDGVEPVREDQFLRQFTTTGLKDFKWDPYEDSDVLLKYIEVVLEDYRSYQRDLCTRSRLDIKREVNALESAGVKFDIYQREYARTNSNPVVVFSFFLRVSELDNFETASDEDADFIVTAALIIQGRAYTRLTVRLDLSPFLQKLLGDEIDDIPSSMKPYTVACAEITRGCVNAKVQCVRDAIAINRTIVLELSNMENYVLIDYAPSMWDEASFLVDHKEFRFMLVVTLPLKYPGKNISVHAFSIYDEVRSPRESHPCVRSVAWKATRKESEGIFQALSKLIQEAMAGLKMAEEKRKNYKAKYESHEDLISFYEN